MSFRDDERKKVIEIRDEVFRDPGGGMYRNLEREFILKNPVLNLWDGIRQDAIDYFQRNQIAWWGDQNNLPTGHLLSSQIACINHLYFIRQRKDIATAILRNVSFEIVESAIVDDGFVEFEAIGNQNYLGEKSQTRGANATSIDAIMVGKKKDGKSILVMIEWKYTEDYSPDNKYIPARAKIYDQLLADPKCPIQPGSFESLYYAPFYQLMRQTLLGWKMVQHQEYNCDEYIHLHIIPTNNKELKGRVTSPDLTGESMSEAWKSVLRKPARYQVISPQEFLLPIKGFPNTLKIYAYLNKRYWN